MKRRTQQPVAAQGELVKSIWLTKKQMAELFGVKEHTIT